MDQTIEKLDEATDLPLLNLWKKMQTQLKDCQQLLMINERILGGLQQGVERFMTLPKKFRWIGIKPITLQVKLKTSSLKNLSQKPNQLHDPSYEFIYKSLK